MEPALNRTVFGQLFTARELAPAEWDLDPATELTAVAVVARTDRALEPIFTRHDIRVVVVDP